MLSGLAAGLIGSQLMVPADATAAETFLAATGGKGPLAAEEQELFRLRQKLEGEARQQIEEERRIFEQEGRLSQIGKLCATPFGIDIVGITEFIALVGALVGGLTARNRKLELERLNEQLRKINLNLRQQARAGTVYAPGERAGVEGGEAGEPGGRGSGRWKAWCWQEQWHSCRQQVEAVSTATLYAPRLAA
jgi:hypothetical protein